MEIRSRYSEKKTVFSPIGSGVEDVFEERLGKDGVMTLVKVGKRDLDAFIQASFDSTKIYNIIDRYALGDVDALSKVRGFFADVVDMPHSLADVHNLLKSIEKKFSELPLDIRSKFGNSSAKFAESLQNGTLMDFINDPDAAITGVPGTDDPSFDTNEEV